MSHICLSVIKDWDVSDPYSHLAGGMTYQDGKLTVPLPGRYYIYAQLFFQSVGRVYLCVNDDEVTLIQPLSQGKGEGPLEADGVFNLKAGDAISLMVRYSANIYMYTRHIYFGTFLI